MKMQKLNDSPFSQMGRNLSKLTNITKNESYMNPNFQNNNNPIFSNPNPNSRFVSAMMDQNREKIRSHENKLQYFFEKNIEDYSKKIQKQGPILKHSYIDYRTKFTFYYN